MAEKISKEIQRKYVEYQIVRQHINAYLEEKNNMDEKIGEITQTIHAIKELKNIKTGSEIWSQFGIGSFVLSDIKDTGNVLVSIGANIVVKESSENAVKILQERVDDIDEASQQLLVEINKLGAHMNRLEKELQEGLPQD